MTAPGTLYIVSAPSGAGKTSLINELIKRFSNQMPLRLSISHTTRDQRPGENQDVNYHFVSKDEFESMIAQNAFLEYAKVFDNYYGTSQKMVFDWLEEGFDVMLDIDWQGAKIIKEKVPEAVGIFILPPSLSELENRLKKRGRDDDAVIADRMFKAQSEISHYNEYDFVIINDSFDKSVLHLRSIILANSLRKEKQEQTCPNLLKELLAGKD